ncbi:MAG: hypothetical protein WB586_21955 [Chthoniobacterales bacterium]
MKALDWFRSTLAVPIFGVLAFDCIIVAILLQHDREGAEPDREPKEAARAMKSPPLEPGDADFGLTTISQRSPLWLPLQTRAPMLPSSLNAQILRADAQDERPFESEVLSAEISPPPPVPSHWRLVLGLPGSTDRPKAAAHKIAPTLGSNKQHLKTRRTHLEHLRDIQRYNKTAPRDKRHDSNTLLSAIGRALGFSSH